MLPLGLVCLLLLVELALAVGPTGVDFRAYNYCDEKLCPEGTTHVACKAREKTLGKKCSMDADIIPIEGKLQDSLVDRINELRDKVAQGGFSGLTAAAKMATMTWDPELAYLAGFNVQTCDPHLDKCRNTLVYSTVGQSVAYRGLSSKHRELVEIIYNAIGLWYREHEVTAMDDILNYIGPHFGKPRENFVQMVVDNCNRVGCAIVQQTKNGWLQTFLTCNYAFAPVLGQPVYNSSKRAGDGCQSGHNPVYTNLCSVDEVYMRNGVSTIVDVRELNRLIPNRSPGIEEYVNPPNSSSAASAGEDAPPSAAGEEVAPVARRRSGKILKRKSPLGQKPNVQKRKSPLRQKTKVQKRTSPTLKKTKIQKRKSPLRQKPKVQLRLMPTIGHKVGLARRSKIQRREGEAAAAEGVAQRVGSEGAAAEGAAAEGAAEGAEPKDTESLKTEFEHCVFAISSKGSSSFGSFTDFQVALNTITSTGMWELSSWTLSTGPGLNA
ncbi:uncharacterized protein LOC6591968 [Drosophila persimilis]|uniref:uncharacterized protein LOC6591968 n=1 Tax=Drosophila persimilis TaxID=7234 RepID=UPI000F09746A|nr:uncharacterized protein LOC6591968 [Drosophila persimilis]